MEVIRVAKKEKRDVLIPHKFLSIFETLAKQGKDKQATELIIAIIRFDMTGEEPTINDDGVAFVWESVIKPQLEENIQKYKEVSKARSEAVGNRYKQDNTNDTNEYNCSNSNQKNDKNTIATDYDVDIDVDIDNDSELKEKINKKEKPQKHKYGQYQNVLLSDDELEKLKTEFPVDWEERIERVSEYCASKGATYKNYLATIRNWARKERPKIVPVKKNDVQSGLAQALEILGVQDG
jgi:hypothetical protein